jgi:hypothetical protein
MDYVRRYLKIEPDEDVKLDYTYYSPKKDNDPGSREAHLRSAEEVSQIAKFDPTVSGGNKRRRLTGELDSNEAPKPQEDRPEGKLHRGPVTPKKQVKAEIPSSQSPESPGLAVISPSQFCGMKRFPLKRTPPNIVKDEPPDDSQKKALHDPGHASSISDNPASESSLLLNSPTTREPDVSPTPRNDISVPENEHDGHGKPEDNFTNTQRTVVYETDAESDYGDFQDNLTEVPDSPREQDLANDDDLPIEDNQDSQHDDSQELPQPVIPSGPINDSGPSYPETNLSSDASICYRRPPQSTQFPLDHYLHVY